MKDLIIIYIFVQIVFILIAILKLNMPEGIFITIILLHLLSEEYLLEK
jgi:hypothetical protein